MKRIAPSKRAADKRLRNLLARATPGDRDEVERFRRLLQDPLAKTDVQAAYDKHYKESK